MNNQEKKELDNALLDLLNKGLVEVTQDSKWQEGFSISQKGIQAYFDNIDDHQQQ